MSLNGEFSYLSVHCQASSCTRKGSLRRESRCKVQFDTAVSEAPNAYSHASAEVPAECPVEVEGSALIWQAFAEALMTSSAVS